MNKLPYAEEINYWQTSKSSPDSWLDKTKNLIKGLGGKILVEGFGNEPSTGRSAYMLGFEIQSEGYKIIWPVLPSKTKKELSARVQATTMLYHDVKARCLTAVVLGTRAAFFNFMMLPDGRTTSEASIPELMQGVPDLILSSTPLIESGQYD